MTEAEMHQKVVDQATIALANIPFKNLQVRTRLRSFLDGSLFFVYYQPAQDTKELLLYAYLSGDEVIIINNIEELAKVMSVYRPQNRFSDLFGLGPVAGIIALLITVTLCWLILKGVTDPPQILSAALTSILGFYFGSKVASKV